MQSLRPVRRVAELGSLGVMKQPPSKRELVARLFLLVSSALILFSVGVIVLMDAFFIRWTLATLIAAGWLLGTVSFLLRPSVVAALIMCAGMAVIFVSRL